ncbi:6915_t:CDS:2, partial [Gigaspora rosea]
MWLSFHFEVDVNFIVRVCWLPFFRSLDLRSTTFFSLRYAVESSSLESM